MYKKVFWGLFLATKLFSFCNISRWIVKVEYVRMSESKKDSQKVREVIEDFFLQVIYFLFCATSGGGSSQIRECEVVRK